jgi:hypothetical protein
MKTLRVHVVVRHVQLCRSEPYAVKDHLRL